MAIYTVGDIQGCYEPLVKLLDKVNFDPTSDRLWAAGDLVNRGPNSLETLRFLKSLGSSFTAILGNHDLHLIAIATGAYQHGNRKTLLPILNAPDCDELCQWLRFLPLAHQETISTESGEEEFLMLHAGIAVGWSFADTLRYAKEVEKILQSELYLQFLEQMYGDEPNIWHSDLKGMARLRLITNILTRMRFCDSKGQLNFDIKSKIEDAPAGFSPWYEYQSIKAGTNILFGHWAAIDGETGHKNIHALDTGCVWGRCLTALRLHDKKRFSISCE